MANADRINDILSRLAPLLGKEKAEMLWTLYHLDTGQRAFMESFISLMQAKYLNQKYEREKILLPPIPQNEAKGEYPLGLVHYAEKPLYPFGLRENEWIHHVSIFGRSGSGKTAVAFIIIANLLRAGKPFLVFDWKRNYRDLLSVFDDIFVFTVGRDISPFSWNPMIPPEGIQPRIWIRKLVEILCHAYFLGEGVTYLLLKAIDSVFEDCGVYEDSANYPTFKDVYEWILRYKAKGREGQWLDSTRRALAVLCFGEFGKAINAKKTAPLDKILNRNVIFELDALASSDKSFFIEALLLWIHHFRMGQDERENFKHLILIEEAHHILLKKKQEMHGEEAITDIILREIRELGESIVLIDQHPSLISKPALGNTYTTIAMNIKHSSDIDTISGSIGLQYDQKEYLSELPIGTAIIKLQGRWFKPFLVKFPYLPIKKGVIRDSDIKKKMRGYSGNLGYDTTREEKSEVIRVFRGSERKGETEDTLLTEEEKMFLDDIIRYPFSGVTQRYRRLGINGYTGNKIKNNLIAKGLVKETSVNTKKGRIKILQMTKQGKKDACIASQANSDNPGIEHEYWKEKLADYYRRYGYDVEKEKPVLGKFVDLVARSGDEKIAVEIETGKSEAVYNIKKDLGAGFDKVISVALSKDVKLKIIDELRTQGINDKRIRVIEVDELE